MLLGKIGITALMALLVVVLLTMDASPASAQEDPARRNGSIVSVDLEENGGGDPDNPVPLDGQGGHDSYRAHDGKSSEYSPDIAAGQRGWNDVADKVRSVVAFLGSVLLI